MSNVCFECAKKMYCNKRLRRIPLRSGNFGLRMDRLCYTVRQIRQEGDYIKRFRSLIHCRKRHKKQAEHVGNLCGDNEFVG